MKIYYLIIIQFLFFSCSHGVDQVLNIISESDIQSLTKVLEKSTINLECDTEVIQVFKMAIDIDDGEILKRLVNSSLFDCIKDNSIIISDLLTSKISYHTKISMIEKGVPLNLSVQIGDMTFPMYYWLIENAASIDLIPYSSQINNYDLIMQGSPIVEELVVNHNDIISEFDLDIKSINLKNKQGKSPLAVAIETGKIESAIYLISKGCNIPEMSTDNPWFLLTWNWGNGYYRIANEFIKQGVLLTEDNNGIEAFKGILYTRRSGNEIQLQVIEWLIENGFDPSSRNYDGKQAVDYLFENRPSIDIPDQSEMLKEKDFQQRILEILNIEDYGYDF